jgi:hypothetical protein
MGTSVRFLPETGTWEHIRNVAVQSSGTQPRELPRFAGDESYRWMVISGAMSSRWCLSTFLLLSFASCSPAAREVAPPALDVGLVHSFLEKAVSEGRVAGAVGLVARGGEIVSLDAVGMADREAGAPMKSDTLFRIASMTKPITSVAVMMLFEEGRRFPARGVQSSA